MNTTNSASLKLTPLVSKRSAEKVMSARHHSVRLAFLAALAFAAFVSSVIPARAQSITTAQLAGSWRAALIVNGGCGIGTKLVTFTLNSSGVATNAAGTYHTPQCGDATETGTFTITYLSSEGHGDATLNFSGAVFTFHIQAAPNGQIFNLVELGDPGNYEMGTAIIE